VQELVDCGSDCVSARLERTFPYEITTETFTFDSFETVEAASDQPHQREHVTQYYYENPEEFDLYNVTSEQLFAEASLQNRTDLRLTLDEADDYEVFRRIYEGVEYDEIVDVADAVRYIDSEGLAEINQHIQ
jgi:spore coat polysaccharide biosynthesis protein SpsF